MIVLEAVAMVAVGLLGLCVVLVRDPLPQSMVFGFFGMALVTLFLVLQAPDVALSEAVVGAMAYPMMILLTLSKMKERERAPRERKKDGSG